MANETIGPHREKKKMTRSKSQSTAVLPWRQWMIFGGGLVAAMAGLALRLPPKGGWLPVTKITLAASLLSVLVGAILWLSRQRRTMRGLEVPSDNGRSYMWAGLSGALLAAFILSFAPIPFPAAWMSNILPILCMVLAAWLASRLLQSAAPLSYRQAQQTYTEGNLDTALTLLRGLEESHPDFHGTYHLQAIIHRQRENYEAARQAANRLIALQPKLYHGYADLGLTLLDEGRPSEAREPLRRAAELAPNLPEGQFNLGMACAEANDHEGASEALRRALRLGLHDRVTEAIARYHLFRALEALGRHAEAEAELRRLRRCKGILRRWRRELSEDPCAPKERRKEQALISSIERAIKEPHPTNKRSQL